jgi:zinc protease
MARYPISSSPKHHRPAWAILVLLASIICAPASASELNSRIDIPEFRKRLLLNGMEVLFFEGNPGEAPFILMIDNGAAFDPVDKWGATYLMASMLLEQTERYPEGTIQEGLRQAGAEIHLRVDWDALYFFGTAPPDRLEEVLNLLSEVIVRPSFDEDSLERVRRRVIAELESGQSGIEAQTRKTLISTIFDGNPYAQSVKGSLQSLQNVYLTDIRFQYRRLMLPNQAKLAIYSPADPDAFFRGFSRRWGSWVRGTALPFTFRQAPERDDAVIHLLGSEADSSLFRWGQLGAERSSPEYFALKVLGQYLTLHFPDWAREVSSSSQIRASARLEARKMPGLLEISIQAPADQIGPYLEKLCRMARQLQDGEIDHGRFQEARNLVLAEFRNNLQDPFLRMFTVLETELYGLGINHISTFGLRLARVTPESLQETVRTRNVDSRFVLTVAGPTERILPVLQKIGRVEVLN